MLSNKSSNKIRILAEFDFVVDLDLAMIKFIKDKYNDPHVFNQDIINTSSESELIKKLIYRDTINPLEILVDDSFDVTDLYYDIYENHMKELFNYSTAYDSLSLMVTYNRLLQDVDVTILCDSEDKSDYIKSLNSNLNTKISTIENIVTGLYDVFYIKYYDNSIRFKDLNGKNIYIANAGYNMEPSKGFPKVSVSAVVGYTNKIYLMDLYKNVNYKVKGEENNEDLF